MFTYAELEQAAEIVYEAMPTTPQYTWPLLAQRTGCELWVKHENHTPIGAFKVRGGLVLMRRRKQAGKTGNVISATRGNHGQSLPFAGKRENIPVTVIVPNGNSSGKNASMRALGAEVIEYGNDFDAARDYAEKLSHERDIYMVPAFSTELVLGVATYAHELFTTVDNLDTVYVPIGLGSGICGTIMVRDMLGLGTRIVGVVAKNAAAYELSMRAGRPISTNTADTIADGMAVRIPSPEALAIIKGGAERIVSVSDKEISTAMGIYFTDTHNIAEGAGAAALAALLQEREQMTGKKVAVILSGGNVDAELFIHAIKPYNSTIRAR
jgi:threonine dehydratase